MTPGLRVQQQTTIQTKIRYTNCLYPQKSVRIKLEIPHHNDQNKKRSKQCKNTDLIYSLIPQKIANNFPATYKITCFLLSLDLFPFIFTIINPEWWSHYPQSQSFEPPHQVPPLPHQFPLVRNVDHGFDLLISSLHSYSSFST